jgi:hypothetical protein
MTDKKQCPEFPYFGAKYPDARCIDGQLYDLDRCDSSGAPYEMFEYHPCPFCNKEAFIEGKIDEEADLVEVEKWIEETRKNYS